MGGQVVSKEEVYSIPVTEAKSGETAIYRNVNNPDHLLATYDPAIRTVQDIYL